MIEFRTKQFNADWPIGEWEELNQIDNRTMHDFEFSYAEYRIGDEIFTEMCPAFLDAFKKVKFWRKLST